MRRPLTTTFLLYALYVTRNPNIVYIEEIYELSSYKLQYNFTSRAVTFGLLCTLIHYKYTGSVPLLQYCTNVMYILLLNLILA